MSTRFQITVNKQLTWIMRDYGMLAVLILLCVLFSLLTISDQHPQGPDAARAVSGLFPRTGNLFVVASPSHEDSAFVAQLVTLKTSELNVTTFQGDPSQIRQALTPHADSSRSWSAIVTTDASAPIVRSIIAQVSSLNTTPIVTPPSYRWPTFLLADNIRNVANQITVIAILAIGMTMVIITAGIDLSVGSLIALSAVVIASLVGKMGGDQASSGAIVLSGVIAILACGASGAFSGLMITRFSIPPFIATLAMMQVAAGLGYIISAGKPIYQLPDSFTALGRGVDPLLHFPYAVILMAVLYVIAHLVMSRMTIGRYIYAIGGNAEAARLAGIRVKGVLFSVYTVCGMLAGLGGIILASQLKSGAPTYGVSYELYVIAAVVVGGTSLSGGEGRMFGTLIGAFVIAVIQNGMNLTNVETYTQKVMLGLVILGAVLLDRLKHRSLFKS